MTSAALLELWARLRPSAQACLLREMQVLRDGFSGTLELHCHKGGARLLRSRPPGSPPPVPGQWEYRPGDD